MTRWHRRSLSRSWINIGEKILAWNSTNARNILWQSNSKQKRKLLSLIHVRLAYDLFIIKCVIQQSNKGYEFVYIKCEYPLKYGTILYAYILYTDLFSSHGYLRKQKKHCILDVVSTLSGSASQESRIKVSLTKSFGYKEIRSA